MTVDAIMPSSGSYNVINEQYNKTAIATAPPGHSGKHQVNAREVHVEYNKRFKRHAKNCSTVAMRATKRIFLGKNSFVQVLERKL